MGEFRVASTLPRKLEELGVAPADVLRHAGLPATLFEQEKIRVSTQGLFALYRGVGAVSRDPAIGLKLGSEARLERYDPVAIAAVSARSLRDALQRLARYKRLVCPEELWIEERGQECRVQFRWLLAHEAEPPVLVDLCFACVLDIARRGTGEPIRPRRLDLRARPAKQALYQAHFGCPVKFGARHNALVFARGDLERPFLTHNPDLFAIIAPQLEAELKQALASTALEERVKGILKPLLAGRRPAIEDVAAELGTSARTLQRRLAQEGLTFQQLLRAARRELARHYLLHSSLELGETAYLLGYEDAHSFFRAFHAWEGMPPGAWRARHDRPA